jgi:hypothetical protein
LHAFSKQASCATHPHIIHYSLSIVANDWAVPFLLQSIIMRKVDKDPLKSSEDGDLNKVKQAIEEGANIEAKRRG